MKAPILALGAALIAGPIAHAQPPASPPVQAQQAPRWQAGDRLPGQYVKPRYAVKDPGAAGLKAAPEGQHWARIDDHAYRIDEITDRIKEVVPLTAELVAVR